MPLWALLCTVTGTLIALVCTVLLLRPTAQRARNRWTYRRNATAPRREFRRAVRTVRRRPYDWDAALTRLTDDLEDR